MLILITYDVNATSREGKKRLRKIAKECCNYGQRVQNSVFECNVDNVHYIQLKNDLLKIIDLEEDSLRIYNLGKKYNSKIENYGCKVTYDPEGELLI